MINQKLSLNQQKCYIHWEPFSILYGKYVPESPFEAAIAVLDVVEVLQPVFEPTSADLKVGCADKFNHRRNKKVNPPTVGWHIRSDNLPVEADVDREFNFVEEEHSPNFEVLQLSKLAVTDWVKKALNQKCPNPEVNEITWLELNFNTVRTKIFTEELLQGQSMMKATHDRYGYYEYPLVRENDQLWVYSPIELLYLFPTFKISAYNQEGSGGMELKVSVGWSWWTQFGFKEREILMDTLPQIEALGWDLDFFDNLDEFYIPREA